MKLLVALLILVSPLLINAHSIDYLLKHNQLLLDKAITLKMMDHNKKNILVDLSGYNITSLKGFQTIITRINSLASSGSPGTPRKKAVDWTNYKILLNLSGNKLKSIDDPSFINFTQENYPIVNLNLSNNKITVVPGGLFNARHGIVQIEELNLSGNRIKSLPKDFLATALYLRSLDLSNNAYRISIPPDTFKNKSHLTYVNISGKPSPSHDSASEESDNDELDFAA